MAERLLTIVVFAAHALLGCGAHHLCLHGPQIEQAARQCSHHVGQAHQTSHSAGSNEDHPCPAHQCDHLACSFVKADAPQVDHGERDMLPIAVAHCAAYSEAVRQLATGGTQICRRNSSSAQLYVWHCALLI